MAQADELANLPHHSASSSDELPLPLLLAYFPVWVLRKASTKDPESSSSWEGLEPPSQSCLDENPTSQQVSNEEYCYPLGQGRLYAPIQLATCQGVVEHRQN